MKSTSLPDGESASENITKRIEELGDWRGEILAHVRQLIHDADPDIQEEWKWRGTPVWSHDGIVCTGESYKQMVKLTFARGASIKDPQKLLNSSLEGNMRPAIDIREGDMILQAAHPGRGGGQRRSAHPTGSQEEVSSRLGGTTMPNEAHYTYQQLGRAHVPLIKDLLRVFGEAFDEVHTYQHHLPDDAYLMRLLGKDQFIALVAMSGPAVVGGLAAYVLDKFEQDRREIYIYDLAVQEDHRRRGVATGLIGELEWIAADRDVYVIFVQADLDDAPAIALYESLGTRETAHHFDIPVRLRSPRQTRMAARKPTIRFPRR